MNFISVTGLINIVLFFLIIYGVLILINFKKGNINDLFNIKGWNNKYYAIETKKGYFKVYEILGVDIVNLPKDEQEQFYFSFQTFLLSKGIYSFIFFNDTSTIEENRYQEKTAETDFLKRLLEIKKEKLKQINKNYHHQKCYIFLNADNEESLITSIERVEELLSSSVILFEQDENMTLEVLKKVYNLGLN